VRCARWTRDLSLQGAGAGGQGGSADDDGHRHLPRVRPRASGGAGSAPSASTGYTRPRRLETIRRNRRRRSWETSPVGCACARTARSTGPARPSFGSEDNAWTQERPRMRGGSRSGRVASAATRAGGRSLSPISVVRRPVVSGVRSAPRMATERRATRDRRAAPSARPAGGRHPGRAASNPARVARTTSLGR
jgi:hypothetical protein